MSILQELEEARRFIGEETYKDINKFLDERPALLISDVYYNKDVWAEFEEWRRKP